MLILIRLPIPNPLWFYLLFLIRKSFHFPVSFNSKVFLNFSYTILYKFIFINSSLRGGIILNIWTWCQIWGIREISNGNCNFHLAIISFCGNLSRDPSFLSVNALSQVKYGIYSYFKIFYSSNICYKYTFKILAHCGTKIDFPEYHYEHGIMNSLSIFIVHCYVLFIR